MVATGPKANTRHHGTAHWSDAALFRYTADVPGTSETKHGYTGIGIETVSFTRHWLTFGRGNPGDEVLDDQFNFSNARRRSNSSGYANNLQDFKTKFEFNEPEPVFEESVHGAEDPELTKTDTASTASTEHSAKSA
jgi:hypothetical protein